MRKTSLLSIALAMAALGALASALLINAPMRHTGSRHSVLYAAPGISMPPDNDAAWRRELKKMENH